MMNYSFILAVLAAVSHAVPTPQSAYATGAVPTTTLTVPCGSTPTALPSSTPTATVAITAEQILAAAPGSAKCPEIKVEGQGCHTPSQAATLISAAFNKYHHTSFGQQCALLGLMTLESGDFQYNINMFPGRPGQGTKAMLQFNFIYDYAYDQPEFKEKVLALGGGEHLELTFPTIGTVPNATQSAIRELVLTDEYTFGAASWYLSTKCNATFAADLTTGGFPAFQNYITNCIDAGEVDDARKAKWCAAFNALKEADVASPTECAGVVVA